jgi:hypothetical protein
MLQQFFGWHKPIGKINIDPKRESSKYTIIKLNDLKNVIIPHFEKYPYFIINSSCLCKATSIGKRSGFLFISVA